MIFNSQKIVSSFGLYNSCAINDDEAETNDILFTIIDLHNAFDTSCTQAIFFVVSSHSRVESVVASCLAESISHPHANSRSLALCTWEEIIKS